MKIAVCIKQVPTREWQPRLNEAKNWIREGQDVTYEMNEPDAYALEEALRLREHHAGEVVVCSAGPVRMQAVIREALARGADRAIHVEENNVLASADAAMIADALAPAMAEEQFDLVLTGLQSDDQGHGQMGVVLAERLDMAHSTIIMEVKILDGSAVRVNRELEGGWFQRIKVPLPAVLTIQSGINQLRYATLKGIMAAKSREIKRVPLPPGIQPSQQIVSLSLPTKSKQTQMIGGPAESAAAELVRRLREEARVLVILVIAEQRDGRLNRATLETLAAAQTLAGAAPIKIVVLGADPRDVPKELAAIGVGEVLVAKDRALDPYTPDAYAMALSPLVRSLMPSHVLLPHTYQTRDFAPLLAARLRKPLITDVTAIKGTGDSATFVRPMFQGKLAAEVRPSGEGPWFVTFQIGAFRADAVKTGAPAAVTPTEVTIDAKAIRQRPDAPVQEVKQAVDLSQAELIVAVGRGIKSQENIAIAKRLAVELGAELAASRPICDNGWLPMERQVGSSGQTVTPKLYLALGISGAIQHLVGMKGSRTIVAINKDPEAPIFEVADYGIVGDLFEIVPALVAELQKK